MNLSTPRSMITLPMLSTENAQCIPTPITLHWQSNWAASGSRQIAGFPDFAD